MTVVLGSLILIASLRIWSTTVVALETGPDLRTPAYFTFAEPVMEAVDREEDEYSDEFTEVLPGEAGGRVRPVSRPLSWTTSPKR